MHPYPATLLALLVLTFSSFAGAAAPEKSATTTGMVRRSVLVVFGGDPRETGRRKLWAPDTLTALHLQSAMEWMGLQAQFHEIAKPLPKPETLASSYAGVIIDGSLSITADDEDGFVEWLSGLIAQNIPVLFFGDLPIDEEQPRRRLLTMLGMRGSGLAVSEPKDLKLTLADSPIVKGEMPTTATDRGFLDLRAPVSASLLMSVVGIDAKKENHHFDAAYIAPWGGVIFGPYISRQFSGTQIRQLFDPYALLSAVLKTTPFPVPDATTRFGRRMLFSHIDGDGFASMSKVAPDSLCSEIIRDRIVARYNRLPITVSIIQAEIRGLGINQDQPQVERYESVARSLFALPNVQVASHTFSHPFIWIAGDDDEMPLNRKARYMDLKPEAAYAVLDPEREITASVRYINEQLATKNKPVELLLWSGNCRPGPEMIAKVRELGLEQLNGGNTIISKRWPGRSGIAPQFTQMGDELQVYAPNQNEMYYTDNWQARFLGGFAKVIETFEMTEQPRRVKPVNIYYHFYSGERGDALSALTKVYDWALAQPLHAVTALDYVKTVRDARQTQVEQLAANQWRISNAAVCQSLRIAASAGYPEVGGTSNVLGWADAGDQRYLITKGSPVLLTLHNEPPTAPSLQDSSVPCEVQNLDAKHLRLTSLSNQSGELILRLPSAGPTWRVTVDGKAVDTDKKSTEVKLALPAKAVVEVKAE